MRRLPWRPSKGREIEDEQPLATRHASIEPHQLQFVARCLRFRRCLPSVQHVAKRHVEDPRENDEIRQAHRRLALLAAAEKFYGDVDLLCELLLREPAILAQLADARAHCAEQLLVAATWHRSSRRRRARWRRPSGDSRHVQFCKMTQPTTSHYPTARLADSTATRSTSDHRVLRRAQRKEASSGVRAVRDGDEAVRFVEVQRVLILGVGDDAKTRDER